MRVWEARLEQGRGAGVRRSWLGDPAPLPRPSAGSSRLSWSRPPVPRRTALRREVDEAVAGNLAGLALDCVEREYPNKIAHVLNGDEDVAPPRELTPAFRGCFDWHSAVHGHWLLVRLARTFPEADFAGARHGRRRSQPDGGEHRRGVVLPRGRGTVGLRAPLRPRLALAARRRAAGVGLAGSPVAEPRSGAARAGGRRPPDRLDPQADAPDPHRRALADRLRLRVDPRLGARRGRRRDRGAARLPRPRALRRRPRLPALLRALRSRLPVAVHRRGGLHAPRPGARGVSGLAERLPAGYPRHPGRWMVAGLPW